MLYLLVDHVLKRDFAFVIADDMYAIDDNGLYSQT
jgi:hypothetical protein